MKVKQFISLMASLVMAALLFSCTVTVDNGSTGTGTTTAPPVKYNLSVAIANDSHVTGNIVIDKTTPDGSYVKGTTITVEATSDAESNFFGWYDASNDGNLVSWDYSYSFSLEENRAIYAKFAPGTIVFVDATLQTAIEEELKKIIDPTGATTLANLAKITTLAYNGNGKAETISDLKGIEYLVGLKNIVLPYNKIESLKPLKNLSSLTDIELNNNIISDISGLKNLKALTNIELSYNKVADISALQKLPGISKLYMTNNEISNIQALIDNPGIGSSDTIYLMENPGLVDEQQKAALKEKCSKTYF